MERNAAGALRLAAARNDVTKMQLLEDGTGKFNVNAEYEGFTALHAAAVQGSAGGYSQIMLVIWNKFYMGSLI